MIHTVKGFSIVNKAEIDVFLELSCLFNDPAEVGGLISVICSRVAILSSNLTHRHISKENSNLKRYMHFNVHSSNIYNSQDMEKTYMSINR